MSDQNNNDQSKHDQRIHVDTAYRKIPKVNSPRALDEKILSEARRLAPEKRPAVWGRWMPMLGTVCMVGVAIVIARPVLTTLDAPDIKVESIEVGQSQQLQVSKEERTSSGSSALLDKLIEENPVEEFNVASPASSIERLESEAVSADKPARSAIANVAEEIVESDSVEQMSTVEVGESAGIVYESKQETPMPLSVATPVQKKSNEALNETEPVYEVSSSEVEGLNLMGSNLSDEAFQLAVVRIKSLIQAGDLNEAALMLDQLKQDCPKCKLPASIQDF